ncbi:MAG: hypothetical protein IKN73_00615 [Alphaproteobacteria bacterium]|nr:hypothetical protein [Alphaproteobacteria bacterium]
MNNKKVFLILFCLCLSFFDRGANAGIFDSLTSVKLYKQIQEVNEEYSELKKAEEAYKAAKEKEQSLANRTLTAATTAAMGIGGMELAMGLSEQKADKDAEADMKAYLSTFRCKYTDGKSFKGGPDPIELPGGNDAKLQSLKSEYIALAKDLKERKEALGMKPGIESEEILDKADMGLYDDENVGITSGNYASLYRANALNSEEDQAKIQAEKDKSAKRVKGGAIAVGVGAGVGILGNSLINGKLGEAIKAAKEKRKSKKSVSTKTVSVLDKDVDVKTLTKADIIKMAQEHGVTLTESDLD